MRDYIKIYLKPIILVFKNILICSILNYFSLNILLIILIDIINIIIYIFLINIKYLNKYIKLHSIINICIILIYVIIINVINNFSNKENLLCIIYDCLVFFLILLEIITIDFSNRFFEKTYREYLLENSFKYVNMIDIEYNQSTCLICYEDYKSNDDLIKFKCNHILHKKCYSLYSNRNKTTCIICNR